MLKPSRIQSSFLVLASLVTDFRVIVLAENQLIHPPRDTL
jgi:hypothetical protein